MREKYKILNNSFKRVLVYNLGSEAGFFSEYNNMVLAMLYCLKHKIKFQLFSKNNDFLIGNGWQGFFEPFCDEVLNTRHATFNQRQPLINEKIRYKIRRFIFKRHEKITYVTSDLWQKFHANSFKDVIFDIPELNIYGSTQVASKKLIEITWCYKINISNLVLKNRNILKIPLKYIGIHVRCGDKIQEAPNYSIHDYMILIQKKTEIKNVFILTDDYRIYLQACEHFPDYNFYTLCDENEKGYFHSDFIKTNLETKRLKLSKLFASVDIINKSEFFIGTYSSNPGMYLGMRMDKHKTFGVDYNEWLIW